MSTVTSKQRTWLYLESEMVSPELVEVTGGNVACSCRRCPDKVEPNDDSAAIVQTHSGAVVLIVADGVGGSPSGHKASAMAVESIVARVAAAEPMTDLRPAILDGIEHANREILELGIGAATTLAVVEIQHRNVRAYQVGDSMTLVVGQRGAIKWKSTPHSPVGYAVEAGMLDEAEAIHREDLHIVSNLVGCRDMHIEIGPSRPLAVRDTVIVASDGLSDNLHLEEIISHGRSGKLLERIRILTDLATERMSGKDDGQPGKPDDLTVLMYASTYTKSPIPPRTDQ